MTDEKNNCWKVYFRNMPTEADYENGTEEDWTFECSMPSISLTHAESEGKTWGYGGHHGSEGEDPNEGIMALRVLRNRKLGLDSMMRFEYDEAHRDREGRTVTFFGAYD